MQDAGTAVRHEVGAKKRNGPSGLTFAAELPRTLLEASGLSLMWASLAMNAKRGDGHIVMVLPGFMGGDDSTLLLRRFLTQIGYRAIPWLQGRNSGRTEQLEAATKRFYRAHHAAGAKISLIGQSLGGVYAREIARQFPDATRCVITLGSPFGLTDPGGTHPLVERLFQMMSGSDVREMRAKLERVDPRLPLGLPSTAVYSRTDGVVDWRSCLEQNTELSENIEVRGSHSGMAMNPDVIRVIVDRLAQDPGAWQKFDRAKGCRSWVYPKPKQADPIPPAD